MRKKAKRKLAPVSRRKPARKKAVKKPAPEKDTLTPKQLRFCQEYMIDLNATQAAIRAEYSKRTAASQASRLLRNVNIQKKIRELIKQHEACTQVDADKVVEEAARIALADIGPAFNEDGTLKDRKIVSEKGTLTPKQLRFVQEYLIDFNGTQAAIRAGYSKRSAAGQAARMLTNANIQKKLRELIKEREVRTQTKADDVLEEATRIALMDIVGAFNEDGTFKKIQEIPEDLRRAISGVEVIELFENTDDGKVWIGNLKKIKFWSKDKNVEVLMRHHGLFLEDNKQTGQTLAEAVHEAMKAKNDNQT